MPWIIGGAIVGGTALYGLFKGTEKAAQTTMSGLLPLLIIAGIVLAIVFLV